jgi:mannan endo-1,6-alpha-mannosidase
LVCAFSCPSFPGKRRILMHIPDTIKDAASKTAYGSMLWYSGNETGQIPGSFPEKWWEGSALFMSLILYWHYTGDSQYNDLIVQGMQWQAGNGDYMPSNYSSYLVRRIVFVGSISSELY